MMPKAELSPGIPADLVVLQPRSKSSKKRRVSGGQAVDEQLEQMQH